MSVVEARYERLKPSLELLADEAVLAQSWKKSDAYIRRHNWYADTLALEQVSLPLPQTLEKWQRQITHVHGNNQAVISILEVDLLAFQNTCKIEQPKKTKAIPAGFKGRTAV